MTAAAVAEWHAIRARHCGASEVDCRGCGIRFIQPRRRNVYCSRRCFAAHRERERRKKDLASLRWFEAREMPHGAEGCHIWTGAITSNGYGTMQVRGRMVSAHRFGWEVCFGKIPDGIYVCHRCDNRACVNPAHLFLGTLQDNHADMVRKERHPRGSSHGRAKLNEQDVREIRRLAALGETQLDISRQFGIAHATVNNIVLRKTWDHLND